MKDHFSKESENLAEALQRKKAEERIWKKLESGRAKESNLPRQINRAMRYRVKDVDLRQFSWLSCLSRNCGQLSPVLNHGVDCGIMGTLSESKPKAQEWLGEIYDWTHNE